ncbi:ABC transporter ATP-binding protein [Fictibacillus nanhaiensis]|uniref:ABC transporter ATP-binding protein n=1 Tax=Fictibacillus nanhaiensis TaxID=742169 RepID=UPI001C94B0FE|nr:ABC transporter ATP-binding protein [Fictibacillus nanhaiensis]MBY6035055.1 ABC transporter ATP-binding protein [Fictibacillus nanhaiensis]
MSFLTIDNLSLSFGDVKVLNELSLSIKKGELVTLLGPSGCGKSTLLRSIAGLVEADNGTIVIDEKEVTHINPKDREVGMVFQSYALFPNMTVEENISFGLKMKKMSNSEIQQKVQSMIQLVGLNGKERSYPRELSGGQQQRAALGRALVVEPKVLLLDEPLSALDAQIRARLQTQIREIQQKLGITMVFVTHDQEEAMAISDRIFLMNNGEIAQSGSPVEIYTRPNSEFVARFMGHYNVLNTEELQQILGLDHGLEGDLFGIRPEAFSEVSTHDDELKVTGEVQQVSLLGNIVRYQLKTGTQYFFAEHLHRSHEYTKSGDIKTLYLSKKDVIPLT